ncbi:MAG: nucleotidyltransferase [Nitrospirae bacterium]|nr:nucleotidyltransferase [Nitrospirota bacterium]
MSLTASANNQLDSLLEFICIELQLTDTQFKLAEDRYKAIGNCLSKPGNLLSVYSPEIYPQGSLKIGTPVKPVGRDEYDLDIVCEFTKLDPLTNRIEAKSLLHAVWDILYSNEIYRDIIELKRRCVRINYKGDFHLDVLPACPNIIEGGTNIVIPDKSENGGHGAWKNSNPKGYAKWFETRATVSEVILKAAEPLPFPVAVNRKPPLKLAVQLLKRWRDVFFNKYPSQIAPDSIVLTTLAAKAYKGEPHVTDAFSEIITQICEWIDNSPIPLYVTNPANDSELLSDKWIINPADIYLQACAFVV